MTDIEPEFLTCGNPSCGRTYDPSEGEDEIFCSEECRREEAVAAEKRAADGAADELGRDVDLVHNLMLGGFADDVDPLDHLGVEGDVITLKAPGRVLRITVARS